MLGGCWEIDRYKFLSDSEEAGSLVNGGDGKAGLPISARLSALAFKLARWPSIKVLVVAKVR